MSIRMMSVFATCAVVPVLAQSAQATLLAYEPFGYDSSYNGTGNLTGTSNP